MDDDADVGRRNVWVKEDRDTKAVDTRKREVVIANINMVMATLGRLFIWRCEKEVSAIFYYYEEECWRII
jgi:hypothetical protein